MGRRAHHLLSCLLAPTPVGRRPSAGVSVKTTQGETARDTEEWLLLDGRKSHAEASAWGQLSSTGLPRHDEHTLQAKSLHYRDFYLLFIVLTLLERKQRNGTSCSLVTRCIEFAVARTTRSPRLT